MFAYCDPKTISSKPRVGQNRDYKLLLRFASVLLESLLLFVVVAFF